MAGCLAGCPSCRQPPEEGKCPKKVLNTDLKQKSNFSFSLLTQNPNVSIFLLLTQKPYNKCINIFKDSAIETSFN